MLQLQNAPVGGSASEIVAQPVKCDNRQPMDQTDETTSVIYIYIYSMYTQNIYAKHILQNYVYYDII